MDDTSPHMKDEMKKRIMHLSGEERINMGSRMFDASRSMVLSSFDRNMDTEEMRTQLFLRLYENDFTEGEIELINAYLRQHTE